MESRIWALLTDLDHLLKLLKLFLSDRKCLRFEWILIWTIYLAVYQSDTAWKLTWCHLGCCGCPMTSGPVYNNVVKVAILVGGKAYTV